VLSFINGKLAKVGFVKIDIKLMENKRKIAKYKDLEIIADIGEENEGLGQFPEPYDYFVASIGLCSGHYAREFCIARGIEYKDIAISTEMIKSPDCKDHKRFKIHLKLPETFPEKYKKALMLTLKSCPVKKTIQANPVFDYELE